MNAEDVSIYNLDVNLLGYAGFTMSFGSVTFGGVRYNVKSVGLTGGNSLPVEVAHTTSTTAASPQELAGFSSTVSFGIGGLLGSGPIDFRTAA